jgi:hypothetical protein
VPGQWSRSCRRATEVSPVRPAMGASGSGRATSARLNGAMNREVRVAGFRPNFMPSRKSRVHSDRHTLEWSKGYVNRLKVVKRSMYGRARFGLFRAYVLAAWWQVPPAAGWRCSAGRASSAAERVEHVVKPREEPRAVGLGDRRGPAAGRRRSRLRPRRERGTHGARSPVRHAVPVTGNASNPRRTSPRRQRSDFGETDRRRPGRRLKSVPMAICPSNRASGAPRQ